MIAALIILALILNVGIVGLNGLYLAVSDQESSGRGAATYFVTSGTLSFGLLLAMLLGVVV